jgi:ferritin-like metal-binding protein YciE
LDTKAKGRKCKAMEGLIEEGKELMDEDAAPDVQDAGLIASAQRIEHYEMAVYGTLRTYAQQLGFDEDGELLEETLEEEKGADQKLTELATECVNLEASEESEQGGEEEEEETSPKRFNARQVSKKN